MKPVLVQQVWLGLSLAAAWVALLLLLPLLGLVFPTTWLTLAALLCFMPGSLVLLAQPLWKTANSIAFGAMAGSVLRIVFVAGSMLAVVFCFPHVPLKGFGLVLSVFYLVSLTVETLFVVREISRAEVRSV